MRLPALALLALILLVTAAQAQDARRRVVLTDGTVLVGVVGDEAADPIVVVTDGGIEQRIPRARVARIEALVGGRFSRVDPTRTRLVFSPTGRTMGRAGQTRLGVLSVVVPNVTYAVSNRVDLGGAGVISFGDGAILVPGAKVQVVATEGWPSRSARASWYHSVRASAARSRSRPTSRRPSAARRARRRWA